MSVIVLILLIAAVLCFGLAAVPVTSRINLIALGLFFWVLAVAIPAAKAVGA